MQASIRSLDRAAEDLSDLDETDASRSQLEKIREIRRTYEELQKLTELATQYSASELVEAISQYADQRDED
jgi:hypothetical protein